MRVAERRSNSLAFRCNVCGEPNDSPRERIGREIPSCRGCRSTVRARGIVHCLSTALFGRSIPLVDFPTDHAIVGAGMTDMDCYAGRLAGKFRYTNTYFHAEPFLDVTAPEERWHGSLDFFISSEVFEHVPPPVSKAFDGAFRILKKGGAMVLTVPYGKQDATVEHYPDLHRYKVVEVDGEFVVVNRRADGAFRLYTDPVFHGGPGETMEMRVMAERDVLSALDSAGFSDVRIFDRDVPEFGVVHTEAWSLPIVAIK